MPEERHPIRWAGHTAVITMPAEIDIANADQVREDLLSLLNRGPAMLIVDMGATQFCDSVGVNALVRAFRRATASHAGIRLVVGFPAVQRVLSITGVDRLIPVYPSVAEALAAGDETAQDPVPDSGPAGYLTACADPDDTTPQPA
jgi:anti-sigma B factor antagonist